MESNSPEETKAIAENFAKNLAPKKGALVIGLIGDLGSGKTTFTQALAGALGIMDSVRSPTFVIEKIYDLEHQSFAKLIHIDAYRIDSSEELQKLGFNEIVRDSGNIVVIEWADRVADAFPSDVTIIRFEHREGSKRNITFEHG